MHSWQAPYDVNVDMDRGVGVGFLPYIPPVSQIGHTRFFIIVVDGRIKQEIGDQPMTRSCIKTPVEREMSVSTLGIRWKEDFFSTSKIDGPGTGVVAHYLWQTQ